MKKGIFLILSILICQIGLAEKISGFFCVKEIKTIKQSMRAYYLLSQPNNPGFYTMYRVESQESNYKWYPSEILYENLKCQMSRDSGLQASCYRSCLPSQTGKCYMADHSPVVILHSGWWIFWGSYFELDFPKLQERVFNLKEKKQQLVRLKRNYENSQHNFCSVFVKEQPIRKVRKYLREINPPTKKSKKPAQKKG